MKRIANLIAGLGLVAAVACTSANAEADRIAQARELRTQVEATGASVASINVGENGQATVVTRDASGTAHTATWVRGTDGWTSGSTSQTASTPAKATTKSK